MNIAKIKEQMAALANKGKSAKNDNKDILKLEPGTHSLRIVPLKTNPENPFQVLYFHYNLPGGSYQSPRSYGEKDPIADLSDKVCGEGGLPKEEWVFMKKLSPDARTFVPVIVRGKEADGVKFYGVGKTVYEQLVKIIAGSPPPTDAPDDYEADDAYGDISDVNTGYDLIVTVVSGEVSGKKDRKGNPINTTTIMPKPKPSVLTKDADLLKKFLNEQPDLTTVYKRHTYEELDDVLMKYLDIKDEPTSGTPPTPTATETPATKPAQKKVSADVAAEFDTIFNED